MLNQIDEWKSDWNFLSATRAQRLTALLMSGIALFLWIARGWDSGVGPYGISLHYSVFVIYGLEYALLNWWLDSVHSIRGIRNLIVSCMVTVGSVAIFEWYWSFGYSYFYGETWVITPLNSLFMELIIITMIGINGILYANRLGVKPKIDRLTIFLLIPAILWYLIGFPQTCYPSLQGQSSYVEVLYIENNLVHLYNVLAKLGMAFATARLLLTRNILSSVPGGCEPLHPAPIHHPPGL